jgi:aryl-alcohol dehydrogenase-like predicted oxidoreductase
MIQKQLILGTANLGMAYGATNSNKFEISESRNVVNYAIRNDITNFDTAPSYGIAEELLGECLGDSFKGDIYTKIPKMDFYTLESVLESLQNSLSKLNMASIKGLLFHDPDILEKKLDPKITFQILESGLVNRVGFSAYSEEDVKKAKNQFPSWTIFQLPENILSRQSLASEFLKDLHSMGDVLHVRSVFMQGLLIANPENLDNRFSKISPSLKAVNDIALESEISPLDLCLSYANSIAWSSGTVLAAANVLQLEEILGYKHYQLDYSEFPRLPSEDLDPRNWSKV